MPMTSPARNLFLVFVLAVIFPFQLRCRKQLIPIPTLLNPSRAAVTLTFLPELLGRTRFEGVGGWEELRRTQRLGTDWLCAARMKMNTSGLFDCSRQLFTLCLVSST